MPRSLKYILILIFLLVLPHAGMTQVPSDVFVSIHMNEVPLRKVLDEIERQSGYTFSYSNRQVDDGQLVTVVADQLPLMEVLDELLKTRDLSVKLVEKQLVIRRRKKSPEKNISEQTPVLPEARLTYSGFVKDSRTGEVLIGATVFVPGTTFGTISNSYGFYSLTLKEKPVSLVCTFVGYAAKEIITAGSGMVSFFLEKERTKLEEVKIFNSDPRYVLETARGGEDRVRATAVRKMPALLGEKDVIKSLALIPGIKFFGDGSTIFYVRGGNRDQNLVSIDEAPIYNPTHMLGFFSTVVPDAIKDVQVYKGDFPANYGGRLSSLIDIRTKDGNMNNFAMDASLGLLSTRVSVEGPVWKEHISYFISGRRSYILQPIQRVNEDIRDLHYSDLHFKVNYEIDSRNRVFLSLYNGTDKFVQRNTLQHSSGINWQNAASTIRWNHLFSDRLFSNITLYASRYDYYLDTWIEQQNYWNSHIDNVSMKADFTWYRKPGNTVRYGMKLAEHFYNPGNYYEGGQMIDLPFEISVRQTHETALYYSDQRVLGDRWSLTAGLRLNFWQNIGEAVEYVFNENHVPVDSLHYNPGSIYHTYATLDPRMSVAWKASDRELIRFSYSRTSQFENLLTNSVSPFTSLEVWLPSGPNVLPQRADQLTAGFSHRFGSGGWMAESELYIKTMRNLIDYVDHAEMLLNPAVEGELRFGSGLAYGWELLISKKEGDLTGWLSYTLSRAFYTIPEINNGRTYPAYSDRPHDLALFLSWELSPRVNLTGTFIYMTGAPFTSPTGFYYYQDHQVPIYEERNNDRLPDYHRLDLALNWKLNRKEQKFNHELVFSIYNVYGRKNPVLIHFNKIENESGRLVTPYNYYNTPELLASQYYIFGVIPSLSYNFSF